jgi:RimJ/RimL family protein N-acetyltransferase
MRLREATAADAELLFDWVNRPDSVSEKLCTNHPIPWATHLEWLATRLEDKRAAIWIAEQRGRAIGQARVQNAGVGLEVDIYVLAEGRRRGLGRRILGAVATKCAARWPGTPLIAKVKRDNHASQRLFAVAGYTPEEQNTDHVMFVLSPPSRSGVDQRG